MKTSYRLRDTFIIIVVLLMATFLSAAPAAQATPVVSLFSGSSVFAGVSFYRPWVCGLDTVLYSGQTYNTVLIGSQCWFKENLNVGTPIGSRQNDNSTFQDQTDNGVIEKYCDGYTDNDDAAQIAAAPASCAANGGLYQWAEAIQYNGATNTAVWSPSEPTGNIRGICPSGWHIPKDSDWTTLSTYLNSDNAYKCNSTNNYIGKTLATTSGWQSSGGTCAVGNTSPPLPGTYTGFTALPVSYRYMSGGGNTFSGYSYNAYFLSAERVQRHDRFESLLKLQLLWFKQQSL